VTACAISELTSGGSISPRVGHRIGPGDLAGVTEDNVDDVPASAVVVCGTHPFAMALQSAGGASPPTSAVYESSSSTPAGKLNVIRGQGTFTLAPCRAGHESYKERRSGHDRPQPGHLFT
jgi:hypothetical protein